MNDGTNSVFSSPYGKVHRLPTPVRKGLSEGLDQWREPVMKRLKELVTLQRGWDGYNGLPVSAENAFFALSIVEAVSGANTPPPTLVPGSAGDLQIEWHMASGDVELHILSPNNVDAWFAVAGSDDEEMARLTYDFTDVVAWVRFVTETQIATAAAAA